MLAKSLAHLASFKNRIPLVYSLLLIIFVPLTLVANTWWNLRAFQRDLDFSVRDQALAVQQSFLSLIQDRPFTAETIQPLLQRMKAADPGLIGASILIPAADNKFTLLTTTDEPPITQDEKIILNQLAWSEETSYFTKSYDPNTRQDLWLVLSPIFDQQHHKIGLVNFKVSTAVIDTVINRTTRDALIILIISVFAVILLIINHLRLFERSLLVDKLQQIDKMKDDFISVASHELKTPLAAIKGSVAVIRGNFKNNLPPELTEWFDMINDSVARLNDLVNDLLNVSRIEQNRLAFELSPVDTAAVISEVTNQLKNTASSKGLQLIFQPPAAPVLVLANPNRFREIMVNLIGNAVKYTLTGSVTVRQVAEPKTVRIMVQDTGVGIAPEDKAKLFHKFSRVYNQKTQDVPGSGLGLWITQAMVERMHGKIYVDSVLDQGTVFTVVFPKPK